MSHEFLRMQKLSGVITESEYNQKIEELNSAESSTETLNENVVGIGSVLNPYPTKKKEVYEAAFSKFLGEEKDKEKDKMGMREEEEVEEEMKKEKELEEGGDYYEGPTYEGKEEADEKAKKALDKKEDELDEKDMETETLKEKIKHHADAIKNIKKELEDLNKDLGEDEEDKEKEEKEVKEAVDMAEEALKKHREEKEMEEAIEPMGKNDQRKYGDPDNPTERRTLGIEDEIEDEDGSGESSKDLGQNV